MATSKIKCAPVSTETTISNILTPSTGVTINSAKYSRNGNVASIQLGLKCSSAITTSGTVVATINEGKRPATESPLTLMSPVTASAIVLSTSGVITVRAAINANSNFYIDGIYLLAD